MSFGYSHDLLYTRHVKPSLIKYQYQLIRKLQIVYPHYSKFTQHTLFPVREESQETKGMFNHYRLQSVNYPTQSYSSIVKKIVCTTLSIDRYTNFILSRLQTV